MFVGENQHLGAWWTGVEKNVDFCISSCSEAGLIFAMEHRWSISSSLVIDEILIHQEPQEIFALHFSKANGFELNYNFLLRAEFS